MSLRVCVFGSSSNTTKQKYVEESIRLGELIAENNFICVNGGGASGVMGGANEGCLRKGGKVRGIIHRSFNVDMSEDRRIKDLIVVDGWDLSDRKTELFEESDVVIVMPGGVGTFDELWDGVCAKSLNMKNLGHKPICIVNIDGFYDGSIQQMHRAYLDGVLYHPVEKYFQVETNVEDALKWCVEQVRQPRHLSINEHEIVRKMDRPSVNSKKVRLGTHHHHGQTLTPFWVATFVAAGVILGLHLARQ
jgi:uncharacterized protein (TIGR00730 family)